MDKAPVGYSSVSRHARGMVCVAESSNPGTVDIRLKRLQLYVNYLEVLLLRKNNEMSELQKIMEMRIHELLQKQNEHERVMIHQASHAAMGEMLGTIAHHWRQPLHVISLVVQNMKDAWEYGEFDGDLLERSVTKAMEQISSLSRTIDDFRMFVNPVKTTEQFNPIRCVEEIVALLSGWFSDIPAIEMQITGDAEEKMRITGCQNAFKQAALNLLNNANDAVQEQQRRIGPSFQGRIMIDFQLRGDDAIIGVADNGGGIAKSAMEHIFEPYFTTKEKSNGIGTGLYVSRLIIEKSMNGTLWAENIPDGAFFGIRLPVAINDEVRI